jgi:hypothetical protein
VCACSLPPSLLARRCLEAVDLLTGEERLEVSGASAERPFSGDGVLRRSDRGRLA